MHCFWFLSLINQMWDYPPKYCNIGTLYFCCPVGSTGGYCPTPGTWLARPLEQALYSGAHAPKDAE